MMCDEVAARYAICASRGSSDWFRCHADANVAKQGFTTIAERVNLVTSVIRDVCRMRLAFSTDGTKLSHSPSALSRRITLAPIPAGRALDHFTRTNMSPNY